MIVNIKLLDEKAKLPKRSIDTDACYDVVAVSKKDHGNGVFEYGWGFSMELPPNTQMDARARSSIYKTGLILSNCIGTIDEGYRGEGKAFFYHVLKDLPPYEIGDRIVQIQLRTREDVEFVEAKELSDSVRGEGGFGHTDLRFYSPSYRNDKYYFYK